MITFPSSLSRTSRRVGLLSVGALSTLGALSLLHVGPAQAQSPGVNLASLASAVSTLQSKLKTDEASITSLQNTVSSQATTISGLKTTVSSLQSTVNTDHSSITSLQDSVSAQSTSISALQTKTAPFSLSSDPNVGGTNTLLTITGVNVQIVDGSGYTDDGYAERNNTGTTIGLGNLIIGYDEKDPQYTQNRTGSHNLIVGMGHNYLSYGGLVAGELNLISGPYATVTGGGANAATGAEATVSGGIGNTASGNLSAVSGGQNLTQSHNTGWTGGAYHSPQ